MGGFSVLAVGDIILDEPDPASFLAPSREVLARGSVVIDVGRKPYLRLRVRRPARHRAARSCGRDGNGRCRGQSRRGPRAGGVVVRRAHGGGAELQLCRASGVLGDLHQAGVRVPARAHPLRARPRQSRRATPDLHVRRPAAVAVARRRRGQGAAVGRLRDRGLPQGDRAHSGRARDVRGAGLACRDRRRRGRGCRPPRAHHAGRRGVPRAADLPRAGQLRHGHQGAHPHHERQRRTPGLGPAPPAALRLHPGSGHAGIPVPPGEPQRRHRRAARGRRTARGWACSRAGSTTTPDRSRCGAVPKQTGCWAISRRSAGRPASPRSSVGAQTTW